MARSQFVTLLLDKGVSPDSLRASCLFSKFASSANSISFPEFVSASVAWTGGSEDERLGYQFKLWDKHNENILSESNLELALFGAAAFAAWAGWPADARNLIPVVRIFLLFWIS